MPELVFTPFPALITQRLRLRAMCGEDAQLIYTLKTSKEGGKYLDRPTPKSIEECYQEIEEKMLKVDAGEFVFWIIETQEHSESIGSICLWNFSEDKKTAEVGYELLGELHGKGYMTEALERVVVYAKEDLKLCKIEAYTHSENKPSISLLEKTGFNLEDQKAKQNIYSLKP